MLCTVDDDPLCNKDAHNTHYGEPSCIKITKHISASDGRSDWNHKSAAILWCCPGCLIEDASQRGADCKMSTDIMRRYSRVPLVMLHARRSRDRFGIRPVELLLWNSNWAAERDGRSDREPACKDVGGVERVTNTRRRGNSDDGTRNQSEDILQTLFILHTGSLNQRTEAS